MEPNIPLLITSFVDYLRVKKQHKVSTSLQYKGEIVRLLRIVEEKHCPIEEALHMVPLTAQPKAQAALAAWLLYTDTFKKFVSSAGTLPNDS